MKKQHRHCTLRYSRPDDKLFDWDIGLYATQHKNDQTKIYHYSTGGAALCGTGVTGNNISGCVGDPRSYTINTLGLDIHNTSRVDFGSWQNAFTYGVDGFQDDVSTKDTRGQFEHHDAGWPPHGFRRLHAVEGDLWLAAGGRQRRPL